MKTNTENKEFQDIGDYENDDDNDYKDAAKISNNKD
jgi:hypothetical protein